ncbi:MAG: LPS export ABC transporter periplasmic protein LptC [Desulfobacteraceae bacterium]
MKKKAVLVKTLLVVLLLSIIAGLALVYHLKGIRSGSIAVNHIKVDASAELVMNTMKQTSSRNGIKEWELEASSARLLKKNNKAEMENVKVSFFLENNDTVVLTSQKGVLEKRNNEFRKAFEEVQKLHEELEEEVRKVDQQVKKDAPNGQDVINKSIDKAEEALRILGQVNKNNPFASEELKNQADTLEKRLVTIKEDLIRIIRQLALLKNLVASVGDVEEYRKAADKCVHTAPEYPLSADLKRVLDDQDGRKCGGYYP